MGRLFKFELAYALKNSFIGLSILCKRTREIITSHKVLDNKKRCCLAVLVVPAAALLNNSPAQANCTLPHIISNGQVADASKVMADIAAVAACADTHNPAGPVHSVQTNGGSGVLDSVGPLENGQIVVGSTGAAPQAANLTAGPGISIINNPGSITISSTGSVSGPGGSDVAMALGAAWAREMIVGGSGLTAGTTRAAKADLGAYVGMRMMANTNSDFASRVTSSVKYTVPRNAIAFVVQVKSNDAQRTSPRYYGIRLYNVTKNKVAAGFVTDEVRGIANPSPGVASFWSLSNDGIITSDMGGGASDVNMYYPSAGEAGDVLQIEAWSSGDGNYRMQDMTVFLVVVDATTGSPIQ